ncbi:MAG: (Fe-S)-binding protein, partial [Deltaproteobacteria bacterium]|nr:(Fe-S)-binding protein [Deltaproteobacteria bacterium]
AQVRDVAEFLHALPDFAPRTSVNVKVAYHDACHLLNGQGVEAQPRELLKNIPGVDWVELHEADVCCGSAGTYNLTEPELAGRLAARKARNVVATGADVLVTGNPGCILQIRAALREQGSSIRVVHTVDFLARAYTSGAAAPD